MITATIRTIAKEARVSVATVSRVINSPALVAVPTRQRVLKIIQRHNFQISREAQMTRRRQRAVRTGRIGFLVPDVSHPSAEMITGEMCKGIQKTLTPRNFEMVLHYYQYGGDPLSILPKMLRENSIDGVLIRPPSHRETLLEFCRNRKAVVLGNTYADLNLPCVLADDGAGMKLIMEHLYGLGHRRIAFVGGPLASLIYRSRLETYRAWMKDHGIEVDSRWTKVQEQWAASPEDSDLLGRQFMEQIMALDSRPTAIATGSDGFAVGLLNAAHARGIRVPDHLSVAGYGDQYYAPFTEPPLTTVHVDYRAIGEVGTTQLLQMIEGATYSVQSLILPTLVVRRSCATVAQAPA